MNKDKALKESDSLKQDFEKRTKELENIINKPEKDWRSVIDFESACEFNRDNSQHILFYWRNAWISESQIASLKLEYCIKTINEGWKPNWSNKNEYKYYNWFEHNCSGLVFLFCEVCSVHCDCGSGFFYKSKEKAEFGAKHFLQLYKIWME